MTVPRRCAEMALCAYSGNKVENESHKTDVSCIMLCLRIFLEKGPTKYLFLTGILPPDKILRLEILRRYGGVYLDTDVYILRGELDLLQREDGRKEEASTDLS